MNIILHFLGSIRSEGIRNIFGVPGELLYPLFRAVEQDDHFELIVCQREESAAFMAASFARRRRGQVAVCAATAGPGATDLIPGVSGAFADGVPMLVVTGQAVSTVLGKAAVQETPREGFDIVGMFEPITKYSAMVTTPASTEHHLRLALREMSSGRPGPVHLNVPVDFWTQEADGFWSAVATPRHHLAMPPCDAPEPLTDPASSPRSHQQTAQKEFGAPRRGSLKAKPHEIARHVPAEFHDFVTLQRYEQYSGAEHHVWCTLVRRNMQAVERHANRLYEPYLTGLQGLDLDPERIPTVEAINAMLAPTGWITACVDGYLPAAVYAGLIANRIFPLSRHIRHMAHIDFSPTPDLGHDVFGHLPLLFHGPYRTYLQRLASLTCLAESSPWDHALYRANSRMGKLKSDPAAPRALVAAAEAEVDRVQRHLLAFPSELTHLARFFLWSIEFGLIGVRGSYRVLGAALLSSLSECAALYAPGVDIRPFSMSVIEKDIYFSDHQVQYYLFESYEELTDMLFQYLTRMGSRPRTHASFEM